MSFVAPSSKPALLRGAARVRQLAVEARIERDAIAGRLLADLGRPPSAIDKIAAENLASLVVKANRLDLNGRNSAEVRRQITQVLRASGFKPLPAAAPAPMTLPQMLAAKGYAPPQNADKAEADADAASS